MPFLDRANFAALRCSGWLLMFEKDAPICPIEREGAEPRPLKAVVGHWSTHAMVPAEAVVGVSSITAEHAYCYPTRQRT